MLLNGVHLLPDLSGALICPKERLVAVSDPIGDPAARPAPQLAAEAIKRLAAVLRQRRPASVVWLGGSLPALLAAGGLAKRDADELTRMAEAHSWHWVAENLPEGLPGQGVPELKAAGLTFRHQGAAGSGVLGEVSAQPWPVAGMEGREWPCFVFDGRRMVMPAFGGGAGGVNVLSPRFLAMFRRPFNALMLVGNRIVTRPRARLEPPPSPPHPMEQ
jgi:metallophosphoesterase superfamily enzyme